MHTPCTPRDAYNANFTFVSAFCCCLLLNNKLQERTEHAGASNPQQHTQNVCNDVKFVGQVMNE